jgi:hypothetical protein
MRSAPILCPASPAHKIEDNNHAVAGRVSAVVKYGPTVSGFITIYSRQKNYERLPAGLKNWVADRIESAREFGGPVPQVRYR